MVTPMNTLPALFLPRAFPLPLRSIATIPRHRRDQNDLRRGARADACPGYVETDAGSAFDVASIIRDAGSPQSALDKVRSAVAKVNAGGGCSIFRDRLACEETMTLANKAIVALQTCAIARHASKHDPRLMQPSHK